MKKKRQIEIGRTYIRITVRLFEGGELSVTAIIVANRINDESSILAEAVYVSLCT